MRTNKYFSFNAEENLSRMIWLFLDKIIFSEEERSEVKSRIEMLYESDMDFRLIGVDRMKNIVIHTLPINFFKTENEKKFLELYLISAMEAALKGF